MLEMTHAITIDAAPEDVWPWLAQMGAGRAGWYSYDFIDNGGLPSATTVLSHLQSVRPGDVLPATPGATDAFVVTEVRAPSCLVLRAPSGIEPPIVTWTFVLESVELGRTRLIVRARAADAWRASARTAGSPQGLTLVHRIYRLLGRLPLPFLRGAVGLGHSLMERRMLRTIERRATSRLSRSGTLPSACSE